MIHLVTFTDERMTISAERLTMSAIIHGVDNFQIFKPKDLSQDFIAMCPPEQRKEKGYWLYIWKPYIIWRAMLEIADGEHLIYADAGQAFVNSVRPVIDGMDQDIMMFSNGWKHVEWCKADVYGAINNQWVEYISTDCGTLAQMDGKYSSLAQTQASLIFFKVTPETRNFVNEWMLWCLMPGFCDDSPSKLPNYPTFAETRWDQSVLCCLQIKYGYRLHWLPVLTAMHIKSEFPNDKYPAISDFHRKRNPGTGGGNPEW